MVGAAQAALVFLTVEDYQAIIPPVADSAPRPLWSVLIPAWNCATHLEHALRSVLVQDRGPDAMEIIVVDDHSTRDDPEEVVRRVAGSRVTFVRQPQNVGKVRNYETGLLLSRGRLVHQLHGDDEVLPGFYEAMESAFEQFHEAAAFFCESYYIDDEGRRTGRTGLEMPRVGLLPGWLEKIVVGQRIQTPSVVLKRETYETLRGFDRRLDLFEDWEMWIRVASRNQVGFIPQPLAAYRSYSGNTTASTANHAPTLRRMLGIVDAYLPRDLVERIRAERNRALAQYFLQLIPGFVSSKRFDDAWKAALDALSFSSDARTVYRIFNYTVNHRRLVGAH
jgi:glycosyltransferase involved in cell wall biosynthesis